MKYHEVLHYDIIVRFNLFCGMKIYKALSQLTYCKDSVNFSQLQCVSSRSREVHEPWIAAPKCETRVERRSCRRVSAEASRRPYSDLKKLSLR